MRKPPPSQVRPDRREPGIRRGEVGAKRSVELHLRALLVVGTASDAYASNSKHAADDEGTGGVRRSV